MVTETIRKMSLFKRLSLVFTLEILPLFIGISIYTLFFDARVNTLTRKFVDESLTVIWYVVSVIVMAFIVKIPRKDLALQTVTLDNDDAGKNLMLVDSIAKCKAKRKKKIIIDDNKIEYTQIYILNRWISDPINIEMSKDKLLITLPTKYAKMLKE